MISDLEDLVELSSDQPFVAPERVGGVERY
jgi:hypothetical protein